MKVKTTKYPKLPQITGNNKERVFTKHWSNLPLHLNRNEMALLSFITYQAKADNSFKYSGLLLKKYTLAVKYANQEYNSADMGKKMRLPNNLSVSAAFIRFWFERLVENGWILGVEGDYVVNPILTYVPAYVNKEQYREMCLVYAKRPADVVGMIKGIVEPKIKSKKSKSQHVYWPE